MSFVRALPRLAAIAMLVASGPSRAEHGPAGHYRASEGPDLASELLIRPDGHFEYVLYYGALDEHAEGHWTRADTRIVLFTDPKPVPAIFSADAPAQADGAKLTLLVAWPDGRGIAGIDFRIGFAAGDPVTGYTQDDGWSMPPEEKRVPQWIELVEPIHGVVSPRFPLDLAEGNVLHFTLTPNDIEVYDFRGDAIELTPEGLILHRGEGKIRYRREAG